MGASTIAVVCVFLMLASPVALFLHFRRVIRRQRNQTAEPRAPLPRIAPPPQPRIARTGGFPVISAEPGTVRPAIPLANDGPGRYRITGVVASTGTDTKMYIEAETLANAMVKAELRGVIVTDIAKQ